MKAAVLSLVTIVLSATNGFASGTEADSAVWEGTLNCKRSRYGAIQKLEVIRDTDQESFKISKSTSEMKAFCPKPGQSNPVKVRVAGGLTPQFLFWGGNIDAKSFDVVASQEAVVSEVKQQPVAVSGPTIRMVGEVSDVAADHTTEHQHVLQFKDESGETFKIVDSPEIVQLHHSTEKNFRVELEGEKTPSFLFWGGNLVVRSFKVLAESSVIPHRPAKLKNAGDRAGRGDLL